MGTMRGGMGMGMKAERSSGGRAGRSGAADVPKKKIDLKKVGPEVWALMAPRKGLIVAGFCLMVVNRVAGLVIPFTAKPLMDKVLSKSGDPALLPKMIALVFGAMLVQAITSFALTQLLSKAGQRLIAELRSKVQRHVGLLSVAYYDENRTGTLVARIMTDVEGVRNLVGTGLVDFTGGLLTAVLAFVYMMRSSVQVTLTVFSVLAVFVVILQYGFKTIRPIFASAARSTPR
jgi:ABC-type multidrug transport system fused ATPase/permease subunit